MNLWWWSNSLARPLSDVKWQSWLVCYSHTTAVLADYKWRILPGCCCSLLAPLAVSVINYAIILFHMSSRHFSLLGLWKDPSLSMKYFLFSQPGLPTRLSSRFLGSNRLITYLPNLLFWQHEKQQIFINQYFWVWLQRNNIELVWQWQKEKKNPTTQYCYDSSAGNHKSLNKILSICVMSKSVCKPLTGAFSPREHHKVCEA